MLKILTLGILSGLVGLAAAQGRTAAPDVPGFPPSSAYPAGYLQIAERVAPNVHVLRQEEPFQVAVIGNIGVVEQSDGLVLIDAGDAPGAGARAVAMIRAISSKPVKAVFITHFHSDHHGGLPEIVKAWPTARIISTAATRDNIVRFGGGAEGPKAPDAAADRAAEEGVAASVDLFRAQAAKAEMTPSERRGYEEVAQISALAGADAKGAYFVLPFETFTDRLVLDDSIAPIELRFLGTANTDGDAVAWLPRQRVLLAGDVVVGPFPYGIAVYPGPWMQVLNTIQGIDYATLVPGHGRPVQGKTYVNRVIASLQDVREKVVALERQGLDLDQIRARADFSAQADEFVGADPWRRRWFFRYWTKPLVGCVFREVQGRPLVLPVGSKTCEGPGSLGPG